MRTPWSSSTSAAAAESAATSDAPSSPSGRVGVEPAAQLPLLAARERGDAARLARVPLDQRQRLQHRVVHARGDVGALVAADPRGALGIALEREPPEPGARDQQQRARHGARGEQRAWARCRSAAAATVPQPRERDAAVRERRVGPEAAALAPARARGRPRRARCPPRRGRRRRGRRAGGEPATSEQEDRPARAIRRRPGPEREVEHDPGAAREREQREDEPDERDVHAEGLRDSRADPGEGTPLSTRREGAQRHPRSLYGARRRAPGRRRRACRARARACRSGRVDVLTLRPSSDLPRMSTSPSWASPRTCRATFRRDDDAEVADVDARLDVRLAGS